MYGFYITAGMSLAGGTNDPYYSYLTRAVNGILPRGYGSPSSDSELQPLISLPDGEGYLQFYRFDERYMNPDWWAQYAGEPKLSIVQSWVERLLGYDEPCGCAICDAGGDCCGRQFCAWVKVWQAGEPGIWWVKAAWRINI